MFLNMLAKTVPVVFLMLSMLIMSSALAMENDCETSAVHASKGFAGTKSVEIVLNITSWAISLLYACLIWPIIQRKRSYMVTISVLCLTPVPVKYSVKICRSWIHHWPLLMGLPEIIISLPESLEDLLYVNLPIGTGIGILAYWLSGFLVRRNPDRNSAKKS